MRSGNDFDDDATSRFSDTNYNQMDSINVEIGHFDSSGSANAGQNRGGNRTSRKMYRLASGDSNIDMDRLLLDNQDANGLLQMPKDRRKTVNAKDSLRRPSALISEAAIINSAEYANNNLSRIKSVMQY